MSQKKKHAGVGTRLRVARERRGLSLRHIADSTKISVSALQALERHDISSLPGGVVSRGFVRAFSAAVGLDPEATVAEFVAQFPLPSVTDGYPPAERIDENNPLDSPSEASIRARWWSAFTPWRLAAVGVSLAALVAYFGISRWSQQPVTQSSADAVTAHAGPVDSSVRLGRPAENSAGAAASAEPSARSPGPTTPVDVPAAAAEAPEAPGGDTSTQADASSPAAPTVDIALDSPPAESSADAKRVEKPDTGAFVAERFVVVVSATRPSWLIATVDGRKTVNRLLEVGEEETLEAGRDLVLTAGDAGAIVMTINGGAAKLLGRTGKTVTARVNRTNFSDYVRHD